MISLRNIGLGSIVLPVVMMMAGCQTLGDSALFSTGDVTKPASEQAFQVASIKNSNAIHELVRAAVGKLKENEFDEASRLANVALKMDITNSDLQFLNGFIYHLMGKSGDASKFELAEQGYKQALQFEPGNLIAQYQLGHLYMDQRRHGLAQLEFAAVAQHYGDDPYVLYNLAAASYYAHDPETAEGALKRLIEVDPDKAADPNVIKAMAVSLAAMNDASARDYLESYRETIGDPSKSRMLERRLSGWDTFYNTDAKVLMAQFQDVDPYAIPNQPAFGGGPAFGGNGNNTSSSDMNAPVTSAEAFSETSMVVVDVVLIGTQEDVRNSRGVNLLNGLQLQFGDPLTGTSGFSYGSSKTKDYLNNGYENSTQTITRLISIPAVTYSLNIANSADANNQVLAKPSLVAQTGQTSEFFSGTEILAAAVSGGNGDSVSVQKEVGVKLAITPEILPNDMLRLHVVAERTFLTDPSNSVVFEFRLDTTKTNVNSTVTMKFDETLILGGLSERETSKSIDGVPILKDIPIVDMLFSQRTEREFERSVLILLTPRRPQYVHQAEESRNQVLQNLSPLEQDVERLHRRHHDWFTPRPAFNEILEKIQGQEFFEEFRSGDVDLVSWQEDQTVQDNIAMVQSRIMVQ
ncbi:hypothetical protein [Thalassospira sp. CH_XMU1448-2]|uniref:hypothetical protein n=1 Tax=Thalassospira sp. CH_XMU1448-2 TaxID=3107773 RepID=UPI003009C5B1